MATVAEVGSSLLSKCLDLCQALCNQGQAFNFSVTIGKDFTFSMDTRSKEVSPVKVVKKKASPSTRRRNALRRQEFLNKKRSPSSRNSCEVEAVSDAPSCDQCDYKAASEKGLKQHKRMKHMASKLASSENSAKQSTPEKEILREELEDSCNISQPSEMRDEEILSVMLTSQLRTQPWFCHTIVVQTLKDQRMTVIKVCLPVAIAATYGETGKKFKIVLAQICTIVLRTVFM